MNNITTVLIAITLPWTIGCANNSADDEVCVPSTPATQSISPEQFGDRSDRDGEQEKHEYRRNDGAVDIARKAVSSLFAEVNSFSLEVKYQGPGSLKSIYLSTTPPNTPLQAEYLVTRITHEQAAAVIGYLAGDGFFDRSWVNSHKRIRPPKQPYYTLEVRTQTESYFEFIPWAMQPYRWHSRQRPSLLQQMDMLRAVFVGEPGEALDEAIKGLEAELQKQQVPPPDGSLEKQRSDANVEREKGTQLIFLISLTTSDRFLGCRDAVELLPVAWCTTH